ncbi:MAG: LuxR family transcriptional regulator [Mesorhizobium sp.]|nr:MAG: LuxR family transcriptional regulator [Mesorhizobium sp.]
MAPLSMVGQRREEIGMIALEEFVRAFENVTSGSEVEPLLVDIAGQVGAANIAYMADGKMVRDQCDPTRFVTYSDEWESRYFEREYIKIDPVALGVSRQLPFDWNTVASSASTRWLFLEAESFGVGRQGISVPLRGDAGERALITLTSFHSDREWQARRWRYQALIAGFAPYLHHLARTLREAHPKPIELSQRQRQCLELYGRGNTPKQIAAWLGISDTMVREHLHRARQKLRSATIPSAVTAAAKLNIIEV